MKGVLLFYSLIVLFVQGCSSTSKITDSTDRRLASELENTCTYAGPQTFTKGQESICNIAYDYISFLVGTEFSLQMVRNFHEQAKRNVITLNITTSRKNLDTLIGPGGLRAKYLRFLLNELSYEETKKEYISMNKKDEAVYNFTLIEINFSSSNE